MWSIVSMLDVSTYGGMACNAQKLGMAGETNQTKTKALNIATRVKISTGQK